METKFNGTKVNYDKLEMLVLDENEAVETEGGSHYEIINGVLTLVQD